MLAKVISTAVKAGTAIMNVYGSHSNAVVSKSDKSPLTEADLVSHRIICAELAHLLPDCPILSEEAADIPFERREKWVRFWLVDPLDGTKEFIKRNGEFTVNIALIENGESVLGVVYAPALDVCYYAARGAGAFVQYGSAAAQPISVRPHSQGEKIKVVASRSHGNARTEALLKQLGEYECINMGSSLKLCLVADGKAHFYPRLAPTMEWDTAAAHAIVKEAGGIVCNMSGDELLYNKADLHNPEFFVYGKLDKTLDQAIKIIL